MALYTFGTVAAAMLGAGYYAMKRLEATLEKAAEAAEAAVKRIEAAAAAMKQTVEDRMQGMEDAVYAVKTAVTAAELRQDRAGGLQNDVSRHAGQALQQYAAEASAVIWLQRRLQACMESSCRGAVQLLAEPGTYWRLQMLEVKLVLCRDLLLQPEEAELQNA